MYMEYSAAFEGLPSAARAMLPAGFFRGAHHVVASTGFFFADLHRTRGHLMSANTHAKAIVVSLVAMVSALAPHACQGLYTALATAMFIYTVLILARRPCRRPTDNFTAALLSGLAGLLATAFAAPELGIDVVMLYAVIIYTSLVLIVLSVVLSILEAARWQRFEIASRTRVMPLEPADTCDDSRGEGAAQPRSARLVGTAESDMTLEDAEEQGTGSDRPLVGATPSNISQTEAVSPDTIVLHPNWGGTSLPKPRAGGISRFGIRRVSRAAASMAAPPRSSATVTLIEGANTDSCAVVSQPPHAAVSDVVVTSSAPPSPAPTTTTRASMMPRHGADDFQGIMESIDLDNEPQSAPAATSDGDPSPLRRQHASAKRSDDGAPSVRTAAATESIAAFAKGLMADSFFNEDGDDDHHDERGRDGQSEGA